MRYWEINNKLFMSRFYTGWMYSLLMIMVTPAIAGTTAADNESSRYSVQKIAERANPWALPPQQQRNPAGQQQPYEYHQQYQPVPQYQAVPQYPSAAERRQDLPVPNPGTSSQYQPPHQWQPQADRFVTPRFLESLKQQQQQHQVMPENQRQPQRYRQPVQQPFMFNQPQSRLPGQGAYGYPSYGTDSVNPLYDTPAVSPWGDGADVLYRGESFPLVPSEALGGFPPMHVPSFDIDNYQDDDSGELFETDQSKVFNPFTFLPR